MVQGYGCGLSDVKAKATGMFFVRGSTEGCLVIMLYRKPTESRTAFPDSRYKMRMSNSSTRDSLSRCSFANLMDKRGLSSSGLSFNGEP